MTIREQAEQLKARLAQGPVHTQADQMLRSAATLIDALLKRVEELEGERQQLRDTLNYCLGGLLVAQEMVGKPDAFQNHIKMAHGTIGTQEEVGS